MKFILGLLLMVSASFGQNFVDICNDSSGNECCASEGMDGHTYWVMQSSGTWSSLDIECRIQKTGARLAVFETRRENDCMIKYLLDEYRGGATKNYAIGLKALDNYAGVYEWHRVDNSAPDFAATLSFTNWATSAPAGKDCVYISVGDGDAKNGMWQDVECSGSNLYGICEYEATDKTDTSSIHNINI